MIISFAGHASLGNSRGVKEAVKEQIRKYAVRESMVCYLGGYGEFDEICALACQELKKEYNKIEVVYVSPYIGLCGQKAKCGLYDATLYPPIENTPPKFAISRRNEWMMAHADLVIAYVIRNYGGAYRSLQAAKRRKKQIINIGRSIDSYGKLSD